MPSSTKKSATTSSSQDLFRRRERWCISGDSRQLSAVSFQSTTELEDRRYQASFPFGSPQSISAWRFSRVTFASSCWSLGFSFTGIGLVFRNEHLGRKAYTTGYTHPFSSCIKPLDRKSTRLNSSHLG